MKVTSFMCFESTFNDQNGKMGLVGPLLDITLINVPSAYSFVLTFGLTDIDQYGKDQLTVNIISPSDIKTNIIDTLIPSPPEQIKIGKYKGMFNFDLRNFVFNEVGTYVFKILCNGKELSSYELEIVKGESNVV